jgi:AcrR family transcriptional regulator
MPRSIDEVVDYRILAVALHEAATHPANRFSTKEIAAKCGISESVIFDHFKTKEGLIAKVDEMISAPFHEAIIESAQKSKDFATFFSRMLDYQVNHPEATAFAVNYCLVFPQFGRRSDFEDFRKNIEGLLDEIAPYFPSIPKEDRFTLWTRFNRELLSYAQLIIDRKLADTPQNRALMASLLLHGLSPYVQKNE